MEREGGAVALLPDLEIVEEPTNVGEEQVADLGFLVERRIDLRKRVFQIPVPSKSAIIAFARFWAVYCQATLKR